MKKILALILTVILLMSLFALPVFAESSTSEETVVPAVDQLVNLLFDGKITVSQILEYAVLIALSIFSFLYNHYKKKLLLKEKAITKTDVEIEELRKENKDLVNQIGLLGNILVSAYLSNNLIDPELKKKLATYAEELMTNTSLDVSSLTEKLILAAQNPDFKETIAAIKEGIDKKADNAEQEISDIVSDVAVLSEVICADNFSSTDIEGDQDVISEADVASRRANEVIDNIKLGV